MSVEITLEGDVVTYVYLVISIYPVVQVVVIVIVTPRAHQVRSVTSQQVSVYVCQVSQD